VVTIKEKKGFIKWFLNNKQAKRRESVWILNYLMDHDNVLQNTHFVTANVRLELLEEKQRLVQMSCTDTDLPPFKYFTTNVMTTDAEKTFHDIRLNYENPLFINLQYRGVERCDNYFMIEEDDDIQDIILGISGNKKPKEKSSGTLTNLQQAYIDINPKLAPTIDNLLDNVTHEIKVKKLKEDIDLALQDYNKEEFLKLSSELNELAQPKKIFETVK